MYFEEFVLGSKTKIAPATINKNDMVEFAKKYDPIPLHTDEEYAKTTFFKNLIAPGVMSFMSVWAKYLEIDLAGNELIAGKSTKIEWMKPVFANDVLSSTCTVSALTKRNEKNGIVELTFEVFNQNGELVLKDVTEMIVKCKPIEKS
ncbi:MAG: MaoC family dehydratase N-terminal domain-containing protein [Oscillospiraceae bacterium]|nr:MaoC family dehydratase N-terminal domain-containing protein [Oscillospiraceae bacterium]